MLTTKHHTTFQHVDSKNTNDADSKGTEVNNKDTQDVDHITTQNTDSKD